MRLQKIAVAFMALTGWLVPPVAAQSNAPGFSEEGKAALSRLLSGAVSRKDTPGVVALVVGRDGVLYERAVGKSKRRMQPTKRGRRNGR